MAEKLSDFPVILSLLEAHEIGYHSSSHSIRPIIPEYTDIPDYEEAYHRALDRETAHIDPLTGKVKGRGGIHFLRDLFPEKKIVSFRAPGGCWSPSHLEAIVKLGIKFDFSTYISSVPVYYRDITFYPSSMLIDNFKISFYPIFMYHLIKNKISVLNSHPSSLINREPWDFIYYRANPTELFEVQGKSWEDTKTILQKFEMLLKKLKMLQQVNAVEVTSDLIKSKRNLSITKNGIEKAYDKSILWSRTFFNYKPIFLHYHFYKYFEHGKKFDTDFIRKQENLVI